METIYVEVFGKKKDCKCKFLPLDSLRINNPVFADFDKNDYSIKINKERVGYIQNTNRRDVNKSLSDLKNLLCSYENSSISVQLVDVIIENNDIGYRAKITVDGNKIENSEPEQKEVVNNLFNTVNECLEKYIRGEVFFDELDKAVKFDKELLLELISEAKKAYPGCKIISSGEIGLCLHNFGIPVDIIVQGGLRKNKEPLDLSKFINKNEEFVFIDDSYFSGKTSFVVKEALEKVGAIYKGTFVIYDGCHEKRSDVKSIYRYYDYYDLLGRPLEKTV